MTSQVNVGTSGWHYQHWHGLFYPRDLPPAKMLQFYARDFGTVEINNSFYKLPTEEVFRNWCGAVPRDFVFAVKGSRFITHMKKLHDPENAAALFFERVRALGETLGPILFQLPPRWPVNAQRLGEFLGLIPKHQRYVFEFRERSWCCSDIYQVLRRHNAALCLHDWGGSEWPQELTADFAYVRMHGPSGAYHGNYDSKMLKIWARRIEGWRRDLISIFVYFNNDQGGYALTNAKDLLKLLGLGDRTRHAA